MEKKTKGPQNAGTAGRRKPPQKKASPIKNIAMGVVLTLFIMVAGIGCGFLTASINTKSDLAEDIRPPASSQIYDANGNELANVHAVENRVPVKITQIPKALQNAFIAVEDNRFYDHIGVDPRGILRAVYTNVTGGTVAEGGSTITQQLAKNAYLTQERTMRRKVQEVFLALQIERQYTKTEILELYLNQIYFGQGAYGVQAAAKTYFGKNVEELTLSECAMLAGIPKSPNYYSPFNNLEASKARQGTVLDQMVKYGYITSKERTEAVKTELAFVKPNAKKDDKKSASYFIDYVTQILIDKYGADAVYKEGLKIYTTLDPELQKAAETAMEHLPIYQTDGNGIQQPQGALVAIDPHTGHVKAMVGGRGDDQFNRATMAERQPGSAFKPFVFVAALENNYTASSIIDDKPLNIDGWQPQNYNRDFHGKVTFQTTVEQSLNVPTVNIAREVGVDKVLYYAQEMGISTLVLQGSHNDRNLSTALGGLTKGVTPMEITSAFGTFANKGVHVTPVVITKVLDRNGKVLEEAAPKQKSVISEASATALTQLLEGVVRHGTGTRANIGRPAAGKTGTTSDYHDAWFIGYTPELVTGVWMGNDNNTALRVVTGGETPAEIWKIFMTKALAGTKPKSFAVAGLPKQNGNSGLDKDEKKPSETKAGIEKAKKEQAVPQNGRTGVSPAQGAAPTPAQPQEPAAPSQSAPEPGAGIGKGR